MNVTEGGFKVQASDSPTRKRREDETRGRQARIGQCKLIYVVHLSKQGNTARQHTSNFVEPQVNVHASVLQI